MICETCKRMLADEITRATGCTEPASVAYAAAVAAHDLGEQPTELDISVSDDFFRNGLNVGIPGTGGLHGLDIAAALGAICAEPERGLDILGGISASQSSRLNEIRVTVAPASSADKVYVRVQATGHSGCTETVIRGRHDNVVLRRRNDLVIKQVQYSGAVSADRQHDGVDIWSIVDFAQNASGSELQTLKDVVEVNMAIAREGLSRQYGLGVGRALMAHYAQDGMPDAMLEAMAYTAAAADARMAGCDMPVYSVAGSGNQGLTATIPVVIAARDAHADEELLLRALAISTLITVHTKAYVGRLSALCGCGISAALGASAAITYIWGGGKRQINSAINTVIADISGMLCDGAKSGCALKIATSVTAAYQAAMLAINGGGATQSDGIVCADAEDSLHNLGRLSNEALSGANSIILQMLDK